MGMPKGRTGNPAGRTPGVPNKATSKAREAIATFVDGNADRLVGWLDLIAEKDPDAAFKAFMSVVEYHIPKLARTEHAGDKDHPLIPPVLKIEFVKPNASQDP